MKARSFVIVFLLALVVLILGAGSSTAMPVMSKIMTRDYMHYNESASSFWEEIENDYQEPEFMAMRNKEISALKNKRSYTQEQAEKEIGRMIDNGQISANYILAKGQYRKDGSMQNM